MDNTLSAHIITYGCQMNLRDGEILADVLAGDGFYLSPTPQGCDVIVVLTCAVREHAVVRALGRIKDLSRHRKDNPNLLIAVGGCVAQTEAERIQEEAPFVGLIFGTSQLHHLPQLIEKALASTQTVLSLDTKASPDHLLPPTIGNRKNTVSAFIAVMRGCNNKCSYCIVPSARGPERYRPAEEIVEEAKILADAGYQQITLIGQNVNAWREDALDFAELLRRVAQKSGIPRLRFVTSHPKNLSDGVIQAMAEEENICPALHLPLQSGSTRVLNAMGRGYTSEEYLSLVRRLQKTLPGIALTTDLLVGFPGETEDDFSRTLRMVEEAPFDSAFTFKYSPRKHTSASELSETLTEEEKVARLQSLIAKVQEVGRIQNRKRLGKSFNALIEGPAKRGGAFGRLASGHPIIVPEELTVGSWVEVEVSDISAWTLRGRVPSSTSAKKATSKI